MLEYCECPRSMAEAMGGNKGGNCWSGAGPRRIQENFPGASAAEILIQESLEVLLILLLHLLRPLQRRCRFFLKTGSEVWIKLIMLEDIFMMFGLRLSEVEERIIVVMDSVKYSGGGR